MKSIWHNVLGGAGKSPEGQVSGSQRSQAQSQQALLNKGLCRQGGISQTLHATEVSTVREQGQRARNKKPAGPAAKRSGARRGIPKTLHAMQV